MRSSLLSVAAAAVLLGLVSLPALAQDPHDPHPTITAVHRYGHRKVARAANAVDHAGQHVRHWKHRKAHNVRAWLNNH